MLESIILCFISVFSAVGIFSAAKTAINIFRCKNEQNSLIIVGVKNQENSVESLIRLLMRYHPFSEILVVDYGSCDDTITVVKKLCRDYPCIHFKEKRGDVKKVRTARKEENSSF